RARIAGARDGEHERAQGEQAPGRHGCGMICEPRAGGSGKGGRLVVRLELRRHAPRDAMRDALSERGRALAEDVGRARGLRYDVVFVSPAERAAETAAWMLRGAGQQLPPDHAVI